MSWLGKSGSCKRSVLTNSLACPVRVAYVSIFRFSSEPGKLKEKRPL